jgi:hypothetical protein
MRFIGLLTSSASGKAGGIVAYKGSTGNHLRIRPTRVTTRSTAVCSRRNIFHAITAAWRSLTPAHRGDSRHVHPGRRGHRRQLKAGTP